MLNKILPIWAKSYQKSWLSGDLIAGLIVTVMLIPQSLAYAMLAGLPPEVGIYASILPLIAYALFGSSMTLAVGPVAVVSLMTANALQGLAMQGTPEYVALAMLLALISGVMLVIFGLLRFGVLSNLLSHPVISGFITGSALLITIGQIKPLLGLSFKADGALHNLTGIVTHLSEANLTTAAIGISALLALWLSRTLLKGIIAKLSPMFVVIIATAVTAYYQLAQQAGVKIVGTVPAGLPSLHLAAPTATQLSSLWLPALLISLVGLVESVSVARSLAQKRKQRIDANKELLGLGAANVASALSGGYPVTGGFARSGVNFSAGANTPLAGVISAILMSIVLLGMTGWFYHLPQTVLAATIIIAVITLVDFSVLKHAWHFDRTDSFAFLATMIGVLILGVEEGIVLGVVLSLASMIFKTSQPHIAVVGRVAGTEHFRNVERHQVETAPHLLALRIDENIYFGNAAVVELTIQEALQKQPLTSNLLLIMSAVNRIDYTGLEMLTDLQDDLKSRGIKLCLAEVKGPVLDALTHSALPLQLEQCIYLSTHEAFLALS
ncbi:MAG: sulfate permease [Methylotenera sp.]